MEHGRVKAAASAAAALKQNIRVGQNNGVHHPVQPKDVAVVHLPLLLVRQVIGPDVSEGAVDVPFHIVDVGVVQDGVDALLLGVIDETAGIDQDNLCLCLIIRKFIALIF